MKRNAPRIGPFRKHTEGYTGQKKNAYRDFKMSITEHKLVSNLSLMVTDAIKSARDHQRRV